MELFAGSAVTALGLEVLTLGGQMEGVDLDRLFNIDGPVHCETPCPPATLCLPLPALGFLPLRSPPWSGGSGGDVTGGEGGCPPWSGGSGGDVTGGEGGCPPWSGGSGGDVTGGEGGVFI